jgi:ER membrane protein complex subunit 8/9
VDRSALIKIILHAIKYPTTSVNGLLLGELRQEGPIAAAEGASSPPGSPRPSGGSRSVLRIYDSIPVCHNFITLSPIMEMAMSQVNK